MIWIIAIIVCIFGFIWLRHADKKDYIEFKQKKPECKWSLGDYEQWARLDNKEQAAVRAELEKVLENKYKSPRGKR